MTERRFAAFILTHGRPDNQITTRTLARCGYTGPLHYVIDNEDPHAAAYLDRFGEEHVHIFDKAAVAETFDTADLETDRRSVVYARNAVIPLAAELGYDYLLQLDDDYDNFIYRWVDPDGSAPYRLMRNMDEAVAETFSFLDASGADVVAWSQGGDHIGGAGGAITQHLKRKAMNVLFMRSDTDLRFVGRINEDVNTYVTLGGRGRLLLTVLRIQMHQTGTQQAGGGMTELYQDWGTYTKSFYTVLMRPDAVKVSALHGGSQPRLHHKVDWNAAVPRIVSSKWQKVSSYGE